MANPTFYWYPDPAGSLEKTDFGEVLSDIQESPRVLVEDAYSGDMVGYRAFLGSTKRVRIILERFGPVASSSRERAFQSLDAHLHKGGLVGFSRDHAKTWAGTAPSPSRGDTVVYSGAGNGFSAWAPAGAVAAGDEMVVESASPDALREIFLCGSLTVSPPLHIPVPAPGLLYTYGSSVVVRWRDFYPVLWLPKDQVGRPFITHDHRRNFTLDITLEYSVAAVLALWVDGETQYTLEVGIPPLRNDVNGIVGSSLEQLYSGTRRVLPRLTRGQM